MRPAPDKELLDAFAYRLRLARKAKGMTQKQLAAALPSACTVQLISKYERGGTLPGSKRLIELSKALGCTIDFLLATQAPRIEWRV